MGPKMNTSKETLDAETSKSRREKGTKAKPEKKRGETERQNSQQQLALVHGVRLGWLLRPERNPEVKTGLRNVCCNRSPGRFPTLAKKDH